MANHSMEQLMQIANSIGIKGYQPLSSPTQMIRSIQRSYNEDPCFATDKRYDCAEICEWRKDCRELKAVWLR